MGVLVKIVDLAQRMIQLSGFEVKNDKNPQGDIEAIFTGLHFGGKFIIGEDDVQDTEYPLII